MKSKRNIKLIFTGLLLVVLSNCSKDDSIFFRNSTYVQLDIPGNQTDRLVYVNEHLQLKKLKSGQATSGDEYQFTVEYILNSPVVEGAKIQASHIVYKSEKLYLSYNTSGELIRGGMEVIDFSNTDDPKITATGITDAEFSSLDIYSNPITGKSYLIMAGAGYNDKGVAGSQIRMFELDAYGYPLMDPQIFELGGFVATDINALGIVTGDNGGFYKIDDLTLAFADELISLDNARSVAYNRGNNQYIALLGNPGRLVTSLSSNPKTIHLGGISDAGTKAIVRIKDGLAYAALGDGGLKVIDLASGLITSSIDRPEVPSGHNAKNYITNGVSINEAGLVFIANGAAGIYVARISDHGDLEVLGFLDLDASVNYVESKGDYLFAAIGEKGVAIIKMDGINGPLPIVITKDPDHQGITSNSAVGGGEVIQNNGKEILNKGICWSQNSQPTIYDNRTISGPGEGSFVSNITGLNPDTEYFIRTYATTTYSTYYGESISFKTAENDQNIKIFTDLRDGHVYKYVEIGNQFWMAENLSYIPAVSPVASGSLIDPFYYVYGYNGFDINQAKSLTSYKTYGVLYNWDAAKSACPEGWHLPSDQEWGDMEISLGMEGFDLLQNRFRNSGMVGKKLKSELGWFEEKNGINSTGFTGLPGGYRGRGGEYKYQKSNANFWSSTEDDFMAVCRGLYYFNDGVYRSSWYKSAGFSVRCIKD